MKNENRDGENKAGDIEQNISPDQTSSISPATTTAPATSTDLNGSINTGESPEAPANSAFVATISVIVAATVFAPIFAIYSVGSFFLFGEFRAPDECFQAKNADSQSGIANTVGIYSKLLQASSTKFKIWRLNMTITCRVGCLVLIWLVISLRLPALKGATFLGLIHWKWSLLALLTSLGYPCFFGSAATFSVYLLNHVFNDAHGSSYFIKGLSKNIIHLIYVVFIFVVWMLCFHHRLQGGGASTVDKYITSSLASVLAGAFLWVLKNVVLLRWESKAIYTRFRARILMAGFRFFFLNLILNSEKIHHLLPWRYTNYKFDWVRIDDVPTPMAFRFGTSTTTSTSTNKRNNVQDGILSQRFSAQQMNRLATSLVKLAKESLRDVDLHDDDTQISEILDVYRQNIGPDERYLTEAKIRQLVGDDDANFLLRELQAEYPSKEINQVPFEKWVVDAHKSCVAIGYTLVDAFAMVKVLNVILIWGLIGVVTLLWLLVTELATTTVLVVIGSPFLALTFVFGDTCKAFSQGFVFAFINHPFNIGDRCIIDGVEVEVKRINIMTTTCLKIGTKEKMLYPNSDLATKLIVNLEAKPDPTDVIELVLDSSTKTPDIFNLQKHIENFLHNDDQRELFEKSCRVMVKEMRNDIKIIIHFQHTMNIAQDVSHSQFLEKKETHRSKLFLEIKQFLDDSSVNIATS